MSYTKGPWMVEDPLGDGQGDALWIVREGASRQAYDWRCIGIVTSDDPNEMDLSSSEPISVTERNANARLISAAPELLEALEAIFLHLDTDGHAPGHSHEQPGIWDSDNHPDIAGKPCEWCAQWEVARAAIAKARGL